MSVRSPTERIRWFHNLQKGTRYGLRRSHKVLVYACLFPYSRKEGYNFTVEDAVYVLKESQGKGLGSMLLKHLVNFCEKWLPQYNRSHF